MSQSERPCEFVPAHEPWSCLVHGGGRTRLDDPVCDRAWGRPIVTIHLPIEMSCSAAVMSAVSKYYPDARVRSAGDRMVIHAKDGAA